MNDRASRKSSRAAPRAVISAVLALMPIAAGALELGLSAAAWSFSRPLSEARAAPSHSIEPGLYARLGAIAGIASRLELEAFAIGDLAPIPMRNLYIGAETAFPVVGSRDKSFFNIFVNLGYVQGLRLADGNATLAGRYLSLRVVPLAIGNPSYAHRDRIFSVGALYELGSGEISLTWSVLAFDIFARRRTRP